MCPIITAAILIAIVAVLLMNNKAAPDMGDLNRAYYRSPPSSMHELYVSHPLGKLSKSSLDILRRKTTEVYDEAIAAEHDENNKLDLIKQRAEALAELDELA